MAQPADHTPDGAHLGAFALALGALGVVFGDIGTSPLYAFREAFEHQDLEVTTTNALGVASIAFWALVIIISVKYLALVMRADNRGEGGILALTALVMPADRRRATGGLVLLGVFGTALLYGDGLITPAISVLSAVEGFEVASSAFEGWVVPLACVILVALFAVQQHGTGAVGKVFGPVMVVWFGVLGVMGLGQVVDHPAVLQAVNPINIVHFFQVEPGKAFLALGSIFLVVTGGEALYADMGHFGRRPIAVAWYGLVLPALVLNYFGQAALLLGEPEAVESPLYELAPRWAITPLAVLATMASVIASQALISGAFSLTVQAVQLDYLPRVRIRHTSGEHRGQVYVPLVNWGLMVGSVGLVIGFQSSSNLAAAYGIAVTATMVITTIIFYVVVRQRWRWSTTKAVAVTATLLAVDVAFFAANVPKIPDGGWFPLLVAVGLVLQMAVWRRGRQLVAGRMRRGERRLASLADDLDGVTRVPGTAVFLFKDPGMVPPALVNNLRHNKVVHDTTIVASVVTDPVPRVAVADDRVDLEQVGDGLYTAVIHFGFMEEPDIPAALDGIDDGILAVDPATTSYFIGRESVLATDLEGMPLPLERL
ncbi:MAG TPA: KUP/HAK/KT family potassium transporter, partial [Acidimicrobiales bacterium]|nr:KUP/HAK/KT family potassium transporter [Acidimicrobiales bacterium]